MKRIARLIFYCCISLILSFGISVNAYANDDSSESITDVSGYKYLLQEKPSRIISLNTSSDEILLNLVDSSRVLAVCVNSTDPNMSSIVDKAERIKIRLPLRANCEVILGLNPDLVLFPEGGPREMVDSLRDLGIKVFVVRSSNSIKNIKEKIKEISMVVGEEEKGKQIIKEMNKKLQDIKCFVEGNKVSPKVVLGFTFAGAYGSINGLFHDICVHAGVVNGAAKAGLEMGEKLSQEQVMSINPDIVFLPTYSHYKSNDPLKFRDDFINNEPYKNLKAVKTNNVFLLNEKYRGCGSHYVVDGIMQIHRLAYLR